MFKKFKFWCQKVLPLTYDDSLSYYEALCKITSKVNDIISWINQLPDYLQNLISSLWSKAPQTILATRFYNTRYYINCLNGDDANDGLTPETAWKTIDRLWEQSNKGNLDSRCYLIESGVYPSKAFSVNSLTIHITPTVDNVTVTFNGNAPCAFYNCHLNVGSSDHPMHWNGTFYFDHCSYTPTNVIFDDTFSDYAGELRAFNCTVAGLILNQTNARLRNTIFTPIYTAAQIISSNGQLQIYGSFTPIVMSQDSEYPFIQSNGSVIQLANTPNSVGGKYKQILALNGVTLMSNRARLMNIKANALSPSFVDQTIVNDYSILTSDNIIYPTTTQTADIKTPGEYQVADGIKEWNCYLLYVIWRQNVKLVPISNFARNATRAFDVQFFDLDTFDFAEMKGQISGTTLTVTSNKRANFADGAFTVTESPDDKDVPLIRAVYLKNI